MRSRLLSGAPALGRIGFPAGAAGMTLLLREIITARGPVSRTNTLGARFLLVRAIGGGSTGGILSGSTNGDGAAGASESLGAYFIDKDSTLSGTIGSGGAGTSGTGTIGQVAGTPTTVTVSSNLGGGTVIGNAGPVPTLGTSGPTNGIAAGQCSIAGLNSSGGTAGSPGGGAGGSSPLPGTGGKGAGPYGGAGGIPTGDINGKAPGGGSAVKSRDASGIAYVGSGGDGGLILEWYA